MDPWDPEEQHIGKAEVALVDFATEIPAPSEPGPVLCMCQVLSQVNPSTGGVKS